jgi:hypothetical protein
MYGKPIGGSEMIEAMEFPELSAHGVIGVPKQSSTMVSGHWSLSKICSERSKSTKLIIII